jgi:NADPH-dependent ferric siderophore reductase
MSSTRPLSRSFIRVTFGGQALARFHDHGRLGPRDLRVKLILPRGAGPSPVPHDLSPGWYQRWRRRLGGSSPEIDVDFVVHGHGVAASWARVDRDSVAFMGYWRQGRSGTD